MCDEAEETQLTAEELRKRMDALADGWAAVVEEVDELEARADEIEAQLGVE